MAHHKSWFDQFLIVNKNGVVLSDKVYTSRGRAKAQLKFMYEEGFVIQLPYDILEKLIITQTNAINNE